MKFLLVYFTGTYNTRYLTDRLESKLVANGHTVDRVEINKDTPIAKTDGYDFIGFSYPIYGFNAPRMFEKYAKKLKINKGQKFFIYKNSGETLAMNNASSRILIRRMKRKKAVLSGEYHFVMPYNIHFPYEKNFVKQILDEDEKLLDILVHDIEKGIVKQVKSKLIYNFAAFFVGIVKIAGDVNSFLYRVDKEKCIKCMKCVNDCPQKNIKIKKDKVVFGHKCECCMRCSFYCPTKAIDIGFLQKWKVTGDYKLHKTLKDDTKYTPYITKDSQGFYKCFIKTFDEIDAEYNRIFGEKQTEVLEQEVAVTE